MFSLPLIKMFIYLNVFLYQRLSHLKVKLIDLQKTYIGNIKRVITEIGGTMIPLTLIFQQLGFQGATGVEWGILSGAISTIGIEMGYQVQRIGRSIFLVKERQGEGDKDAEKNE